MQSRSWQGIRHYTLPERLAELVTERPDAEFARFGDWRPTYAEIDVRGDELAGGLNALGVESGERVATLSPNRYELVELLIGVAKLGAIQVPLNPYLKGEFLRHQLADSAAAVIVTDMLGWNAVRPLLPELPSVRHVLLLDEITEPVPETVRAYTALPTGPAPQVQLGPEDTMSIIYTSGTTGEPKGCVLSHGYYARVGETLSELMRLTYDDVFFSPLPFFHASSQLCAMMPSLSAGIPIVFTAQFSASGFFRTATEEGATVANGVGAMASMLLNTPPGEFDRSHRLRLYNVSPLHPSLHEQFQERFGVDPWAESYGQTECVFQAFASPDGPRDRESNGRPLRDLELAMLDDSGQPVPDGEVGEICVRPRHRFAMFDGYWRRPEATLKAVRGLWYRTGDYGMFRESGAIQFVDRKKDALRVRGENVSSLELEAALLRHPDIVEAAVHAMESDMGDDEIKACLVVKPSFVPEPAELFSWMVDNVPYFAVPRYVEVIDELPRTHVGRVQKHVLRARGVTPQTCDFRALGLVIEKKSRR